MKLTGRFLAIALLGIVACALCSCAAFRGELQGFGQRIGKQVCETKETISTAAGTAAGAVLPTFVSGSVADLVDLVLTVACETLSLGAQGTAELAGAVLDPVGASVEGFENVVGAFSSEPEPEPAAAIAEPEQ